MSHGWKTPHTPGKKRQYKAADLDIISNGPTIIATLYKDALRKSSIVYKQRVDLKSLFESLIYCDERLQ